MALDGHSWAEEGAWVPWGRGARSMLLLAGPSSASSQLCTPQGRPRPLGTGAPWLGSPGRGGSRWAAARTGCGSRGAGPRQHQALAPPLQLPAASLRPRGLQVGRVGEQVVQAPHVHRAQHRERKGRMEGCRGRGQVWVPAGWSGFQGSGTPRGFTGRPLVGGWDSWGLQKEVSGVRSLAGYV